MWLREGADTGRGNAMAPLPFLKAVRRPRQPQKRIALDAQLVLGQWADILANGSAAPLHGFVFSLRPGEVLFTFPDLPTSPEGLEAGHEAVVRYASSTGRHTGRAAILRVASGPPVTVALQRLARVETEQRRQYPRLSVRLPATLAAGVESPLMAGDGVDLTVPGPARTVAMYARHVTGKVLRVERRKRAARVASVEFSFTSEDERDAWARLVLALQRRGK